MQSASRRRAWRAIGAVIVVVVGAAVGLLVGLVAAFVVWVLLPKGMPSDDASISSLMLVAVVVVPVATVAGAILALVMFRRLRPG